MQAHDIGLITFSQLLCDKTDMAIVFFEKDYFESPRTIYTQKLNGCDSVYCKYLSGGKSFTLNLK